MKYCYKESSVLLVLFFLLAIQDVVHADGDQSEEVVSSIDCSIPDDKVYKGEVFKGVYIDAVKTSQRFCNALIRSRIAQNRIDNEYVGSFLAGFAVSAKDVLDDSGLSAAADYELHFDGAKRILSGFRLSDMDMPEMKVRSKVERPGQVTQQLYFEPGAEVTRAVIDDIPACGELLSGKTCADVFKDFQVAFNIYRSAYDNVYDNRKLLDELGAHWDEFLTISKSQTALEVWLTTWAHSKHFKKDHLVGPPSSQIIALHPRLIYNSMDKAQEGFNQEMGLAVEWIGVNYWDWDVPLGVSLTTVYVDRPGVDDVGHGIMLHVFNSYSVGWAKHDEEDSIYVSIDLLKLFEDKQTQYDKFVKNVFD